MHNVASRNILARRGEENVHETEGGSGHNNPGMWISN